MRRGPQVDQARDEAARLEMKTAPTIFPRDILFGVPMVQVVGGNVLRKSHPKAEGSHSPEPTRDSIRSALLLGDIQRFESLPLLELVGWAYSFSDLVNAIRHPCSLSFYVLAPTNRFPLLAGRLPGSQIQGSRGQ